MSEIRATTISDAAGTGPITLTKQSAAKAWANVIYTSGTPSSICSLNVSSIADTNLGTYTVSFSSSFNSSNDMAIGGTGCSGTGADNLITLSHGDLNASAQVIKISNGVDQALDQKNTAIFHGDLA